MLTCRQNGKMYLHDILTTNVLCEVILPDEYEMLNPWQPIITFGGEGELLYIRGTYYMHMAFKVYVLHNMSI